MATRPSLRDVSRDLASLSPIRGCFARPQQLTFVDNKTLYWLEGTTQELFSLDVTDEGAAPSRVIVVKASDGNSGVARNKKLTREEELLRERQRTLVNGITWYAVRPSDGVVFFISAMSLYVYAPAEQCVLCVLDFVAAESVHHHVVAKPCLNMQPLEGDMTFRTFLFVCAGNLYELNIESEAFAESSITVRLEAVSSTGKPLAEFGTADYIMQEEFDRYTGYCARGMKILTLHTDASALNRVSLAADGGGVEEIDFPRVGDANAVSSVAVYDRTTKEYRCVPHYELERAFALDDAPREGDGASLQVEYITRFGFVDDNHIYLQLLDRKQERCVVVAYNIHDLPIVAETNIPRSNEFHQRPPPAAHSTSSQFNGSVLWHQTIPWAWCEITSALMFNDPVQIVGAHVDDDDDVTHGSFFHLKVRRPASLCASAAAAPWLPLTSGSWNVQPGSVKRTSNRIFFESNADNRLGCALFCMDIPLPAPSGCGTTEQRLISQADERVFNYAVAPNGDTVAYVSSTSASISQLTVLSVANNTRRKVNIEWDLANNEMLRHIVLPKIVTVTNAHGVPISGAVFLPRPPPGGGQPKSGVPLMMYVYGGPHVQLVFEHSMEVACSPAIQTLLAHGVAVAIVDNQMSNANGLRDQSICKKRMGQFEVADYVLFKHHLCGHPEFAGSLDGSRFGVFGWSYGGYVTLLCLAQASHEFKLGFAGAPVGDWRLYDSGYTERYMGLLEPSNDAYDQGTIAKFASGFPEELDRLFIAHGLLDENVHFAHTCDVINALVEHCKPYQLLVYPGERHGLRQKKSSRNHYDAQLIKTVMERL